MLFHWVIILLGPVLYDQNAGISMEALQEHRITQDDAVKLALENNPDLRVDLHNLDAARTLIQQAKEFPNTSVDLDFDQQQQPFRSKEIYYGISQEIEYPGRRGLRIKLAGHEVKDAQIQHSLLRREIELLAKTLYQTLALAQQKIEIARQSLEIALQMQRIAEEKFSAGSIGKLEVLRARIESAVSRDQLRTQEMEEKSARMPLNYLLGRPPDDPLLTTPLQPAKIPPTPAAELLETAARSRLELRQIENRKISARVQESLARSELYPDFAVGFSRHHLAEEPDNWDITASISIPIFGRPAIMGRVAHAKAAQKTIETVEKAVRAGIELEIKKAHADVTAISEKADNYRVEILELATQAFELAEKSFREGEISSLELLESQRTLQEVKLGYVELICANNLAIIELERTIGADLDRQEDLPK
jgi:cobalt-zinc-cadmium efflux system outer membrane protein